MSNARENGLDFSGCDETLPQGQTREELIQLCLKGFSLSEVVHGPCSVVPTHAHTKASFCFFLSGRAVEIVESTRLVTQPGMLLLRAPGLKHSDHYGETTQRGYMVEFEDEWLPTSRHFLALFQGHKQFRGGQVTELAMRIYRESKVKDTVAPIIVEGLMLEMLGHASRSLRKPTVRLPSWLSQARDLLHGKFNDPLNLLEIANSVGVHPTHLARTFKKHYRTTMGEYLRQLRLDWATRQLSETEDSIAEIAAAAGFYDQSHFSHLFKQRTGFSPAEFRASSHGTEKS